MLQSLTPNTNAITGTVVGGAMASIIVWLIDVIWKIEVPATVAGSMGVVLGAFIGHVAGFIEGVKKTEEKRDDEKISGI